MTAVTDYPLLVFAISFFAMSLSTWLGATWFQRMRRVDDDKRGDLDVTLGASLTLLGLLVGFSFSMAVGRYDQRKNYEEEEANAIGTEYVRAELLPAADGAKVRALLKDYLDQRILFYSTRDAAKLRQINARTAALQNELWAAIRTPVVAQPTPVMALVAQGMNDVLNSQGYTQAAWWNRIPVAAWVLMAAIAICCNLMLGYRSRKPPTEGYLLQILPLVLSISFFLIADIDSPRGGVIHLDPENLISLAESLRAP